MTPKQQERIVTKILKLKKALSDDRKAWGGYHRDSRGYRYLIPELYLKIEDYKGAIRYFNWFFKTFEGDISNPIFLFEYCIALFKTNKIQKAENIAVLTFAANTYLFDYFLEKEMLEFEKNESSNWESKDFINYFTYKKSDTNLTDFVDWLDNFMHSKKFLEMANEFIEIQMKVKNLPVGKERSKLFKQKEILLAKFV